MIRTLLFLAAFAFVQPNVARSQTEATASNFGLAVDLCLQHVRDRNPVDAFRAAGFDVVPMDEGTFDFSAPGVTGFLAPLLLTGWCWVSSEELTYAQAETIAYERALFRFPQGVSGPAERGWSIEIAPGADCSGLTVLHANRIHTLIMTNVPFWEGCDSPATGAVYFN
jgi:hypothetical protein